MLGIILCQTDKDSSSSRIRYYRSETWICIKKDTGKGINEGKITVCIFLILIDLKDNTLNRDSMIDSWGQWKFGCKKFIYSLVCLISHCLSQTSYNRVYVNKNCFLLSTIRIYNILFCYTIIGEIILLL